MAFIFLLSPDATPVYYNFVPLKVVFLHDHWNTDIALLSFCAPLQFKHFMKYENDLSIPSHLNIPSCLTLNTDNN